MDYYQTQSISRIEINFRLIIDYNRSSIQHYAILTLINADLCKNVSTHSNVFINTFYARGPLDLLTNGRIPIKSIVKNLNRYLPMAALLTN